MGIKDLPVCPRHDGEVPMNLRTLHSDVSAPKQVLGVYTCPECGSERRLPIATAEAGPLLSSPGAV